MPCRYAVTLTGNIDPRQHLELDADAATIVDGCLMVWHNGVCIFAVRSGGWSTASAIQYQDCKEKEGR
jgi:hypothetical protein